MPLNPYPEGCGGASGGDGIGEGAQTDQYECLADQLDLPVLARAPHFSKLRSCSRCGSGHSGKPKNWPRRSRLDRAG